jgi:hypothetical protein
MNLRLPLAMLHVPKIRFYGFLFAGLALFFLDGPRRSVPPHWQSGLLSEGKGQFSIRREGDITLKYVTASLKTGNLELVPVPYYRTLGPGTESVREIARRFGLQNKRTVIAAINGGFFDTKTGLPIGFLLRDKKMEFFNMPQGFKRSMIGFSRPRAAFSSGNVHISSPHQMPKVWVDTLSVQAGKPLHSAKVPVHHINIPGGKNAFCLFTPTYGNLLRLPAKAVYLAAIEEPKREGVYRIIEQKQNGTLRIPHGGLVVAMHGDARSLARHFPPGTLVRPQWSLPPDWTAQSVTHGLLAGPRLLEDGSVQVTAKAERLDRLKSRDRVALGVKANGEMVLLWAHKNTAGDLPFEKVASILAGMGARDAIALDGGRSRAIFAQQGEAAADERYFEGGRPVSNALVLAIPSGISS